MAGVQDDGADLVSVFGWLFQRGGGGGDRAMSDDGSHDEGDMVEESRRGPRAAQQYIAALAERIEAVEDSVCVSGFGCELCCWQEVAY